MLELHRHCFDRSIEYTWIIHIVPGVEVASRLIEILELFHPVLSSITIKEIHERRITRPSFSEKRFAIFISDKDILCITLFPIRCLKLHTISVNEVIIVCVNMWVDDCHKTSARIADLIFHSLH